VKSIHIKINQHHEFLYYHNLVVDHRSRGYCDRHILSNAFFYVDKNTLCINENEQ